MTNSLRTDGNTALAEDPTSYSSNIPMISDVNHLTLQDALILHEVEKFPEGLFSPEEIVSSTQELVNKYGLESFWENRKLHMAQLEQLQTF
jgi:hypothetical protein